MLLGYNTNGFAHHDPFAALEILAEIGYQSVAITLDHGPLNPFDSGWTANLARLKDRLRQLGLKSVIETGARFLLDPRHKHEPTLVSADATARQVRIDFLRRAIDAAAYLDSDCVSLWSGIRRDDASDEETLERLTESLRPVLRHATDSGVTLGFEPEPGMFIDTLQSYRRLLQWIDAPHLQLTLDLGHLWCQGELPIADYIARWRERLVNVHIEDMRAGIHEHLMFGDGEMQFPPILDALARANYLGGLHVELSRHSHEAPTAAQRAYDFLRPLVPDVN
ncbi:MAG: sugar phosphate isomerase/epimerase family protein [Pirellulaceae bacterium]|nr:sugar phosphate isomerase/epimerase family protein [Pirellulaceae bacterium]